MSTLIRRTLGGTVRAINALHLRWLLRGAVGRLPPKLRSRLGLLQVRLGFMEGLTLVPVPELEASYRAALLMMQPELALPGTSAYLEFGVFVGTSMACMYRAATGSSSPELRLVGFDSFQGMPPGVENQDDQRWHPGDLYSDIELTRANLKRSGVPLERVELVRGFFEDSLNDATRSRIAVTRAPIVMVDCVIASATSLALKFIEPLIRDRAIVYFDDWAVVELADRGLGERAAFEAWLVVHPEMTAEELPALQYNHDVRAFLVTRGQTGQTKPTDVIFPAELGPTGQGSA